MLNISRFILTTRIPASRLRTAPARQVAGMTAILLLSACELGRALFFSGGKVDGCMYWRGLAVHSACIVKVGEKGAIAQKDFVDCVRSRTTQPEERQLEIITADGAKFMTVCSFDMGSDARFYYRYEPEQSLVFSRRVDCAGGCRFENRTWRVEFADGEVRFEKLFEAN